MATNSNKKIIDTTEPIKRQKKFLKRLYIFLGIGCIVYYVFPFILYLSFATEEGQEAYKQIMSMVLMGVNPLYVFIASYSTSRYADKKSIVPFIYSAYFIPSAMMLLGPTALVYVIMYIAIGYFGMISLILTLGRVKKEKEKRINKTNGKAEKVSKRRR